ncbi:calexcitin-2-like [Homalodisca vitripennis]|uniref:calexcitin-2-like n=2 Tax=Homalodisca vitripennis TaxID=197043 RepID=UPI001EE9D586|nr:calexcitin-2-like [Homalodisca vitripennis]
MALSQFRMKKFMYLFNVFFDTNRSGTIDKKDFDMATENICKVRGWKKGDPQYEKTKTVLNNVWIGLQAKADADNDQQVTNEEWCKMWEEYSRNPNSVLDWQLQFRDFMFDLEDTSGDGAIDEEEFAMICSSYNVPEQNARDAFRKFSRNGTLEITREKFGELWVEYFASEDPSAPGNFIFGVTKFE